MLHFRRSLEEPSFFHSENLASYRGLIFVIFRRRASKYYSEQHAEMSLFVKHIADKQ